MRPFAWNDSLFCGKNKQNILKCLLKFLHRILPRLVKGGLSLISLTGKYFKTLTINIHKLENKILELVINIYWRRKWNFLAFFAKWVPSPLACSGKLNLYRAIQNGSSVLKYDYFIFIIFIEWLRLDISCKISARHAVSRFIFFKKK